MKYVIGVALVFSISLHASGFAQGARATRVALSPLEGERAQAASVTEALKANLRQNNKLVVIELRPDLPTLKRAVLEHRVAKADIDSKEVAARLRVGQALDVDYVLYGDARGDSSVLTVNLYAAEVKTGREHAFKNTVGTEKGVGNNTLVLSAASTVTAQFFQQVLGLVAPAAPVIVPTPPVNTKSDSIETPPASSSHSTDAGTPGTTANPRATHVEPVITTPAPSPPSKTTEYIAYSTQAEALAAQGNYAEAIQQMKTAINLSPADMDLRLKLVEYYRKKGMDAEADSELQRALELEPDSKGSRDALVASLLSAGSKSEGIKLYRKILKDNPKDTKTRLTLGDALWNEGKIDDAALEYAQASQDSTSDPVPYERLARLYASKGDFRQATDNLASVKQLKRQDDDHAVDPQLYRSLIQSAEIAYARIRARMDEATKSYANGSFTLESYANKIQDLLPDIENLTDFLTDLDAPMGYKKSQDHRTLAASLLSQCIRKFQNSLIKGNATLKQQAEQFAKDSASEMDIAAELDRRMQSAR